MKKVVLVLVLLALGAAAGVVGHQRLLAQRRAASAGELRLHGNIEVRDAQLAFLGEELIAEVRVEEGDRVEAGDLIATLRTERLKAEIAATDARIEEQQARVERLERGSRPQEIRQARAEVSAAEARVANAAREIERLEATAQSGASSAQELDDARSRLDELRAALDVRNEALALAIEGPREEDIEAARAQLAAREAERALLQRRLLDSELRAPAAGVVQSRILEPGEMASPGRAVITLALTDPKWVRAWVPEPDVARVRGGMRARVFADALGGKTYPGQVGFLSPVAEFTPKNVETEELRTRLVYEVRITVEDPGDELRLGMPVTVDILADDGAQQAPEDSR